MTALPTAYALERYFEAARSLSLASKDHPKRVSADTARACLRTLAERKDAIGRRAAEFLSPRKVNGIWMEI